ncbi:hypothetical protein DMH25_07765 [Streptomyces sp. WAC 01325]|uniref:hypothetical protein n=1 Tax=Streptomyces sp. WAC 01325 TaxID=2203202 RepID=UPI000F89B877|nr:hypothetical protein [Streptomyces sp. WAC 01325]RSN14825.1 hypothetical protein DMH25_07765 [Streptomyces sp. WAC 01325]
MTPKLFSAGSRRIATRAGGLAVAAAVLALVVGMGWPQSWWPGTGHVTAADARVRPAGQDPCDLIVGPAKEYCERGTKSVRKNSSGSADEAPHGGSGTAWMLIPPAVGLTAILVWRRRPAGQGRR